MTEEIGGKVKMTGEVRLDDGKYGQIAFRTQENRKIRSSDGCGVNSVPSTMVRGYDFHELGGYLGNIGLFRLRRKTSNGALESFPMVRPFMGRAGRTMRGSAFSVHALAAICLGVASVAGFVAESSAADNDWIRPYLKFQIGNSYFANPDSVSSAQLESPSGEPSTGSTIGVNLGKYFSLELSVDFVETDLITPGGVGKVGEYAMWTVIPQARFRYPMRDDRLVPYFVIGAGWGSGEFNDRNFLNADQPVNGSFDSTFVGAVGAGIEYFVRDSVALGVEVRHVFGFETEIEANGRPADITLDATTVGVSMRLFFDSLAIDGPRGSNYLRDIAAQDSGRLRAYYALRAGAGLFTDTDSIQEARISVRTPPLYGAAIGVNFNKYWGVEFATEYTETELTSPQFGRIAEYSLWTVLGLLRLRYPILNDRLSPYMVVGGGLGFGELNDRVRGNTVEFSLDENDGMTGVAAIGVGFDYFVADNIAVGLEARHTFLFSQDSFVNQESRSLDLDHVSMTASLRVFFP